MASVETNAELVALFTDHLMRQTETTPSGCMVFTGWKDRKGYGRLSMFGETWHVHRLSWTLANGRIADGLCVCHHCDNPPCINPDHLFLGTRADNNRDRMLKGRNGDIRGRKNYSAELTEDQVYEIRHLAQRGVPERELAYRFAVSQSCIKHVVKRRSWAHLPDPPMVDPESWMATA